MRVISSTQSKTMFADYRRLWLATSPITGILINSNFSPSLKLCYGASLALRSSRHHLVTGIVVYILKLACAECRLIILFPGVICSSKCFLQRHVAEFYISDFQSGLRALVKAGYGARVTPCVEESSVVDIGPRNKDLPSDFVRWLGERNLSSDDREMRLKEGYIKEGSEVTVMGMVQRHENVLMIVPPRERVSTGCRWGKFLLPGNVEGLVISCNETSKFDGIPL